MLFTVENWYRRSDHVIEPLLIIKRKTSLNRPGFTGELLVQMLGCFFIRVQGLIEVLLCFLRRDVSDFAV